MAYIAYKPRVERVRINEMDYCIEEKWYIVKGGYDTIFELCSSPFHTIQLKETQKSLASGRN